MTDKTKGKLLCGTGVGMSVGVPLAATVSQFPIWVEHSADATVSGIFVVLALLSAIPLIRWFRSKHKAPSSEMLWTLGFVILYALNSIIEQMILISFFGALANWIGAIFYKLGVSVSEREQKKGESLNGTD